MYFDAHSDIWTDVTFHRLRGEKDVFHRYHAERLKAGGVEGSIFVLWVDPPHTRDYRKRTGELFSCVGAEIAETSDFRIVHDYDEMLKAREDGVFYVFIGIEGMAAIGSDLSGIDRYYDFGARHAMLTWNEKNDLAHGAVSGSTQGLSDIGKKAVKKIQDKGMIVDVSHLNEAGFWDIAKISAKPIIASHSNCSALRAVRRNLSDDQLRAIRDLNGCVGLNAYNSFITDDPLSATVRDLANHAAHMIDVMGIDHVGCGFDFFEFLGDPNDPEVYSGDGTSTTGLASSRDIPNLFAVFAEMGMSREDMEKIAFRNFHRIINDCIG